MNTRTPFYACGRWLESEETLDVMCSHTEEHVGTVYCATHNHVQDIVHTAKECFSLFKTYPHHKMIHALKEFLHLIENSISSPFF